MGVKRFAREVFLANIPITRHHCQTTASGDCYINMRIRMWRVKQSRRALKLMEPVLRRRCEESPVYFLMRNGEVGCRVNFCASSIDD